VTDRVGQHPPAHEEISLWLVKAWWLELKNSFSTEI
jgi:hypothetical protein